MCPPEMVGEAKEVPIQDAAWYARIANAVAMKAILKQVGKKVMKAAQMGRISVKVGYLPMEVVDHLTRRGFTYNTNEESPEDSYLYF